MQILLGLKSKLIKVDCENNQGNLVKGFFFYRVHTWSDTFVLKPVLIVQKGRRNIGQANKIVTQRIYA